MIVRRRNLLTRGTRAHQIHPKKKKKCEDNRMEMVSRSSRQQQHNRFHNDDESDSGWPFNIVNVEQCSMICEKKDEDEVKKRGKRVSRLFSFVPFFWSLSFIILRTFLSSKPQQLSTLDQTNRVISFTTFIPSSKRWRLQFFIIFWWCYKNNVHEANPSADLRRMFEVILR